MGDLLRSLAGILWAISSLGLLLMLLALIFIAEWPWCLGPVPLIVLFHAWGEEWAAEMRRLAGVDDGG